MKRSGTSNRSNATNMTAQKPVMGVLWMVVTGLLFVCVTAVVKHVGTSLPGQQAAFMRYFLGLVFLIPMIKPIRDAHLSKRAIKLFALRGLFHSIGVACWFYAMTKISIAEVTAMNYLSPVYVTIGAAIFLGERLAARRVAAVCFALLGAFIILRPGFREISTGHIAMLFTAALFAGSYLIAKIMADEVSPVVVVGMLSIMVTIGLFPMAIAVWITPTWTQTGWMFLPLDDMDANRVDVFAGLSGHWWTLHHDPGLCSSASYSDAACDLFTAGLGCVTWCTGVSRACRSLGDCRWSGDTGLCLVHYLA